MRWVLGWWRFSSRSSYELCYGGEKRGWGRLCRRGASLTGLPCVVRWTGSCGVFADERMQIDVAAFLHWPMGKGWVCRDFADGGGECWVETETPRRGETAGRLERGCFSNGSGFLGSVADDVEEALGFEGCAADEGTVDVRAGHEFCGVVGFDGAAVLDADFGGGVLAVEFGDE